MMSESQCQLCPHSTCDPSGKLGCIGKAEAVGGFLAVMSVCFQSLQRLSGEWIKEARVK